MGTLEITVGRLTKPIWENMPKDDSVFSILLQSSGISNKNWPSFTGASLGKCFVENISEGSTKMWASSVLQMSFFVKLDRGQ
jgi:hypothetical protein